MEAIFFRHGEKEHSNTQDRAQYRLDSPLKGDQTRSIERVCESVLRGNSAPDILLCSPISRTRQTAKIAQRFLQTQGHEVLILVFQEFGEYFGWQQANVQDSNFHPETLNLDPKIESNMEQFHIRVRSGIQRMMEKFENKKVWVFTHRIVIWSISRHFGSEITTTPFLGTIGYKSGKVWMRRGNCWVRHHSGRIDFEDGNS